MMKRAFPWLLVVVLFCVGFSKNAFSPVWEDITVQVTGVNVAGGLTNPPTVDTTEDFGALTFVGAGAAGSSNDMASIVQFPHSVDASVGIVRPHIHLRNKTAGNGTATWEFWYKAASPVVGNYAAAWTVATVSYAVPVSTATHQLVELAHVDLSGYKDSTVMLCFLRRTQGATTDTSSTDINLLAFDVHYQRKVHGSFGPNGD